MSYTKGTWEIVPTEGANKSEYPQYVVSRFDTGGVRGIALIRGAWLSESDANARLIAAAPEMYEMLYTTLNLLNGYVSANDNEKLKTQIKTVLAKADGD